ncbi:MAG: serine hydrolase [Thermoplasmatales archaeon]
MDCDSEILKKYKMAAMGYTLLVNYKGEEIINCYDGSITELGFSYSSQTVYDLASLTKVLATLPLTLILLDRGEITLKDTISSLNLFPEFKNIGKLTIENLLTHTSGMIPDKPLWKIGQDKYSYLKGIDEEAERASPYTQEWYSDLNFILLGFVLEEIYGKSLDKAFRDEIALKLGLRYTTFNPDFDKSIIAPTENTKDRGLVWGKVHDEKSYYIGGVAGHAGLFSNADEISKLIFSMMDETLFSRSTFLLSTENRNRYVGGIFGLGWMTKTERPDNTSKSFDLSGFFGDYAPFGTIGHTGFTGTSILIDLENEIQVILLTNRVYPSRENEGHIRFRRLLHNSVYRWLGVGPF